MADRSLFDELLRVHEMIRRDLARVRFLAEDAAGGAAPEELREDLSGLKSSTLLWQLRSGCLRHCRFVHAHHSLEDGGLFPTVRGLDRELGETVDRLEAEHRAIAELVAGVERAAAELEEPPDHPSRGRLVAALDALGVRLLEHLGYEEEALEPTLKRMSGIA